MQNGGNDICKSTNGNGSRHQDSNDNGVLILNFATSKTLDVQSTIFSYRNIHKYTWNFLDGKTHNQIDHILIDGRRHSSMRNVRSVITICWFQKLEKKFYAERLNLMKLSHRKVMKQIRLISHTGLQLWRT